MEEWITISPEDNSELWEMINAHLNISDNVNFKFSPYSNQSDRELKVLLDENGNITYVKLELHSHILGGAVFEELNLDGEKITRMKSSHKSYEIGYSSAINHPYESTFPINGIIECINDNGNTDFRVYNSETGELNFREVSDGGMSYKMITHENGKRTNAPLDIKDTDLNKHLDLLFLQDLLGKNISELTKSSMTK